MKTAEQILNGLSEDQQNALLNEQLPEELEKEAQAEVDEALLSDALYDIGYLMASEQLALEEGEGDLNKVASAEEIEQHNVAFETAKQNVETLVNDLGLADIEDEVSIAKTAQAMAGIMFEGWSDCVVKTAAGRNPAAVGKYLGKAHKAMKEMAGKALGAGKKHAKSALKAIRKKPLHAAGAVAGLGALGYLGKKMHEKKASEGGENMDSIDLAARVNEDVEKIASIAEGFDKLAAHAAKKGDELKKHLKAKK